MSDPQSTATAPGIIIAEEHERNKQKEYVLDFIERSNRMKQPFVSIWDEVLDNYMVVPFGEGNGYRMWPPYLPDHPTRYRISDNDMPRLKDPETHQIIESLTGQAMGLLMGSPGYITASPIGPDDPEKARLIATLLMALLEQGGIYRTHWQLFKNAFTFGTAVLEIGWQTLSRDQLIQVPIVGPDGTVTWDLAVDEVVYRDQPLQREVLLWDFYPDPSGTRIHEDMAGVAKRFMLSKSAGIRHAMGGQYDKTAVFEVLRRFESAEQARKQHQGGKEGPFPQMSREVPDVLGSIPGFEYWGEIPWKPRGRDDSTNRVITLWGDEVVRTHINPYMDGMIPFVDVVVNPIAGRFYGLAPAEVVRFLQDSADQMLMLLTEGANKAVRPTLLMGNAFGGDPKRLKARRFGDIIPCANPEMVKPLEQDLNILQLAGNVLLQRKMMMREGSGMTNPLQSIPGPQEKSATEASELVRLASQKVENMVQLVERDPYPKIGKILHSRLRQFALEDGYIATLAGGTTHVPYEAVNADADIRFSGSRQTQSKYQKAIAFKEALTVLTPEALMTAPEVVVHYLRDVLDFPDAQQIVELALQRMLMIKGLEKAMGGSAQPETQGKPGTPSGGESDATASESGASEREGKRMA